MRNLYTVLRSVDTNGNATSPRENNYSGFYRLSKALTKQIFFVSVLLFSIVGGSWGQTTLLSPTVNNGGFESGTTGWTIVNAATNRWQVSNTATAGFNGVNCAYISNSGASPFAHTYTNTTSQVSSIYRDIAFPAGETTITLTFRWICQGEGTAFDRMRVWLVPTTNVPNGTQYTATGLAPTGIVQVGATNYNLQGTWATATVTIPAAYAGTTSRLVFQWRNDGSGGSNPPIAIDDITLISSCTGAVSSAATAVTSSGATANWAALAGASSYNLRYRVVGSGVWTTVSNIVGTSSILTGLTANTSYEYQVQANAPSCTTWSALQTFYTGYCLVSGTNGTYYISNFTTTGAVTNINNTSGYSAGGYGNYTAISMSSYAGQVVNFSSTFLGGGTMGFRIYIDWNNDLDFLDANENPTYGSGAYVSPASGSFTVPAGTPNGNYRMRIVADYFSTTPISCGASTYLEAEDYTITIAAPPSCVGPTALTSSAITSTSATISWTAPATAPASGYEYYVSTVNSAPTAGTTPTGTTAAGVTTASLTGLTANTTYYFWVRSNCGGANGTSAWAGSSSFYTGYCQPSGMTTSTSYYLTNVVTTGGVTNISNSTTASAGGYGNYSSSISCSNYQGISTSVSLTTSAGTNYYYCWIDWNNDLDFADANETVFATTTYTTGYTGTINIPVGTPNGTYRMRVANSWSGAISACGPATYGEYEDYSFIVTPLPVCSGTPAPGNTVASQTAFCSGTGTVNLSISTAFTLSGISYQWQSSTDGVSYTNVGGATSATYTTPTLSSTTYYQCVVTCSAGGSANSTPVAIVFDVPSAPTATNSVSCGPGVPTGTVASTSGLTNPNLTWWTASTGGNVALTSYTGALTSYYSNDFSSNTGIGTMTGNASLTGGVVQLTPNLGSQLGALTIPASGVSADKYNVSFNLITSNVAQTGADGLSYSFGDDVSGTSTTVAAETGSGTKLKVSFDDYGTAGNGISGIRVIYGSTISDPGQTVGANGVLAYNATTAWTNGSAAVNIDINNLGQLTLTVNGTAIFTNLQLPAAYLNADKSTWKHGFKARTGGVSMIHSIDNVNIQQSSYVEANTYPNNVLTTTTFYVTETNAGGCQSTATPITFTVNSAPAMTLSTSSAAICPGASTNLVTLTSDPANYETYTWTPSSTVSGSTAAGWNFTPTSTTTYTLTGTNATTQCSNVATVTVTLSTVPPAISVTPSSATLCVGNIQSLVATGGSIPSTIPNYSLSSSSGTYTALTGATVSTLAVGDDVTESNLPIGFNFTYGGTTFTNFGFSTNGVIQLGTTTINAWTNALSSNTNIIAPLWDDNYVLSGTGTISYQLSGTAPNRVLTVQWNNISIGGGGSSANPTNSFQAKLYETSNLVQFVYGALTSANGISASIGLSGGTAGSYLSVTPAATPTSSSSSENTGISSVTSLPSGTTYTFTPPTPSIITWAPTATLFTNNTATTAYTGSSATTVYAQPTATTTYTVTATNTAGCTSTATATLTLPTAGTALSQNNENATCTVNQNGWVHFYHSSGRLIGSINSQGQNLGAVTVTSYVDPTNALVPACTNPNPIYSTSVMQRHWVITPTNQPTTPVLVRFPYSNAEFSGLTSAASTNANANDDLLTPADLGMTKYSNGTAANVNGDATDNCGSGTSTFHTQLGNGSATTYSAVSANYVDFSIPGFSEFWLHGSAQSSPLPVELVNFQANCSGEGKVDVTWATASEHNSANFTVEKSRDGINWTVLSSVAGAGNSTQMINYAIVDNNAASGVNYYRLTQTDFDGASETFNIASANCGDNTPLTTVKVYPNPSAGDFYIDFTSEEITGASVITITDARGMAVYTQNVTVTKGSNVFHIENMEAAPGMYYIQVSNGTATSNIVKHSLR